MVSIFTLEATDGDARAGLLCTPHGDVPTPAFMPVATQGSVKALDPEDLKAMGARILLANTYHLYLRPGVELIRSLGGLHSFIGWDGPILTDSGGFQGFSLAHLRTITEDAIVFKSHVDGSMHTLSPESAMEHQRGLGADIVMQLDVCLASDAPRVDVEAALERTGRWAARCIDAGTAERQALFGIVQGGLFTDLRRRSAEHLLSIGFPGYAVGGLSVGESKDEMYETLGFTAGLLPAAAPRYLMGVGSPEDLVEAVARGIDMFDCVLPTRIARNGALFVPEGRVNIDTSPFKRQTGSIMEGCDCYTCQTFSAAYVHHLFRAKELLAYRLATIHNLRFVLRLMEETQSAIRAGSFDAYRAAFAARYVPPDQRTQREQKRKWLAAQGRPAPSADQRGMA